MTRLKGWDLFSGIGGFSLGLKNIMNTTLYCEMDPSCHAILHRQMGKGNISSAPIVRSIQELQRDVKKYTKPDIITAGFPCTNISTMGDNLGLQGSQSSLFYNLMDVVNKANPKYVFLENVRQIVNNGLHEVISRLESCGYKTKWCIVSAKDMGAPQIRSRWFCLAYKGNISMKLDARGIHKAVNNQARRWKKESIPRLVPETKESHNRFRALGNSVVPICVLSALAQLIGVQIKKPPENIVSIQVKDPRTKNVFHYNKWGTPCASITGPCSTFTGGYSRTVYTQMMYDKNTKLPKSHKCNPEFIEWLMGYPLGWTKT